jgi:hypothetical protein
VPASTWTRLVDEVGGATFVELFEVDGILRSVVVTSGRVRAYSIGSAAEAAAAVDSARFVLRQAARGRPVRLADIGTRLQGAARSGGQAVRSGGGDLADPRRCTRCPWGLLPALAGVPVTVVPTASAWLRARSNRARRWDRVLVVGPGLVSGGAEVPMVAAEHPEAVVLRNGLGHRGRCLEAMDGAALVHVAAHGRFRRRQPDVLRARAGRRAADRPRLRAASARAAPVRALGLRLGCDGPGGRQRAAGLATALMSLGTAGILSSVTPVNDAPPPS